MNTKKLSSDLFRLSGTIERIIWPKPNQGNDSGYAVIAFAPDDSQPTGLDRQLITNDKGFLVTTKDLIPLNDWGNIVATGYLGLLKHGQTVTLTGTVEPTNKNGYGPQFKVQTYEEIVPKTVREIFKVLCSGIIKGVGESLAEEIVKSFGKDTYAIFDDPNAKARLQGIKGIAKTKAQWIVESWRTHRAITDLVGFLGKYGISLGYAVRAYKKFGLEALPKIQQNPYILIQVRGIGFKLADSLGLAMGIEPDSSFRLQAGLLHVLQVAQNEGHVYLEQDQLITRTVKLFTENITAEQIEDALGKLLAEPSSPVVVDVLGDGTKAIYDYKLHKAEENIARQVESVLSGIGKSSTVLMKFDNWKTYWKQAKEQFDIDLHKRQKEAVQACLRQKMVIVTGGPGTGKTTLLKVLISVLDKAGLFYRLAAPTGKAAKRMEQSTSKSASTVHRLLGAGPDGFTKNREDPIEGDVLIVDEMSMVDTMLMSRLMDAVPDSMHVCFIGDPDQLPSVGPGNVLKDLLRSQIPSVELTTVFRQGLESSIITNAHKINNGDTTLSFCTVSDSKDDFYGFFIRDKEQSQAKIVELVTKILPEKFGYKTDEIQVLSPQKNGALGINALNVLLQVKLNPPHSNKYEYKSATRTYRVKDRVMQIVNNHDTGIMNGDTGLIEKYDSENEEFLVRFSDGKLVTYEPSQLVGDTTHAYAITVHKSQGSEFPVALVVMTKSHYMMLRRNLLYTAVTRATDMVVVVGEREAVSIAIRNNAVQKRNSSLWEKLP